MSRRMTLNNSILVRYHSSASDLLAACQNDFKSRERDANIILPFALKTKYNEPSSSSPTKLRVPQIVTSLNSDTEESSEDETARIASPNKNKKLDDQFWISVWTSHGRQPAKLDIVLSCTNGPIGKYPIFLYSNVPDEDLTPEFIRPRIDALIGKLRSCLKFKRVFSVFGPVPLTQQFTKTWSSTTGAIPVIDPYYAAKHTFCTKETLNDGVHNGAPVSPISPSHTLRLAEPKDLISCAQLCHDFAAGSDPFFLSCEDAIKEARGYIQNKQMYVYDIDTEDGRSETASIVCVTRSSWNVAAITKVFTNPNHRGRKCAEKLVRYVCQQQLFELNKQLVVLFVAHDNKAAEKVYDRVGFQGLWGKARPEGVSDWVEIGFEDTELGHW